MATTEGSLSTTPCPGIYINVLAVPRSIERSLEKRPRILLNIFTCFLLRTKKSHTLSIKQVFEQDISMISVVIYISEF